MLQGGEAVVPEDIDKRLQFAESLPVHPVEPSGSVTAEAEQTGIGQQPEMLGGVKIPSERSLLISERHQTRLAASAPHA